MESKTGVYRGVIYIEIVVRMLRAPFSWKEYEVSFIEELVPIANGKCDM